MLLKEHPVSIVDLLMIYYFVLLLGVPFLRAQNVRTDFLEQGELSNDIFGNDVGADLGLSTKSMSDPEDEIYFDSGSNGDAHPNQFGPHAGDMIRDQEGLPKRKFIHKSMKLAFDNPECGLEIKRYCPEAMRNKGFYILDCLQSDERTADSLSLRCQNFLWSYKYTLTHNDGFDRASNMDCSRELKRFPECAAFQPGEGKRIPCLIEHFNEVESATCRNFLTEVAVIVFSDYRFMEFFIQDCHQDISDLKCGRLPSDEDSDSPHLQGSVVACLTDHRKQLSPKCKKSLFRVAELQSDDFHLDRPLYYACKKDRETFCSNVVAGGGAVFSCLYKQLGNPRLSDDCRGKLETRQQLVDEDVKIDKTFYESCKTDIKKHHCAANSNVDNDDVETDLGRSRILLCLETAHNNVSFLGKKLHGECLQQMFELRSELMQDYKISPELVAACEKEINEFCDGLEEGGNTIHCLMGSAADKKGSFGHECKAQVGKLLHVVNPFEDIALDRPLQKACGDVVKSACQRLPRGDGNLVNCLLENLDNEDMTDECENRLLEIQYFAVRDFKLDHHLFKACQEDAAKICYIKDFDNPRKMTAENGLLTFACLHRHLRSDDPSDPKLSKPCRHEVKRVMRERANKISLMPEVETACMHDLSELCSEDDEYKEKGGEMECLQSSLDDLRDECREVVSKLIEEQGEYLEMDRDLMKACTRMMKEFCEDIMEFMDGSTVPSEVLDCLIEHKNDIKMDAKCAVGIEHHQLISLKDFRFNHRFKEACKDDVKEYCKLRKTKFDVVACLSEHVRNDTLLDVNQRIKKQCRKQLRFELLQRSENIRLDPELQKKCGWDVKSLCHDVSPGNAEVLECLKKHKRQLSDDCHELLFKREEISAVFGDYALLHTCKKMIRKVCRMDMPEVEIFDCLREHKNDDDFDETCRSLVLRRQVERAQDFRLNPHIQKSCRADINMFCDFIYYQGLADVEIEGKVINCLKKKFISKTKSLTMNCEFEIRSLIKEAALDINLNPVMMKVCKSEIKKHCLNNDHNFKAIEFGDAIQTFGEGAVVECLRKNYRELRYMECKSEVAFVILEGRVEVNVDPLLHSACQKDLITLCSMLKQGQGRQMACLLSQLETNPMTLTEGCRGMLNRRKNQWEYAATVAPFEFPSELYHLEDKAAGSPSLNHCLVALLAVVTVIFIVVVGIMCRRKLTTTTKYKEIDSIVSTHDFI